MSASSAKGGGGTDPSITNIYSLRETINIKQNSYMNVPAGAFIVQMQINS